MNQRGHSREYMLGLWRQAVRTVSGRQPWDDSIECHHIIRVGHKPTSYDWRNGIVLTPEQHRQLHQTGDGLIVDEWISAAHRRYLEAMRRVSLVDYLTAAEMSRAEFLEEQKDQLKRAVRGEMALWDVRWFEIPEAAQSVLSASGFDPEGFTTEVSDATREALAAPRMTGRQ